MNRHSRRQKKALRRAELVHAAQTIKQHPVDLDSKRLAVAVEKLASDFRTNGESLNVFYPAVAELIVAECIRCPPSSPNADAFLERPKPGEPVNWRYLSRIVSIADTLYALKDCNGFNVICSRLNRQSFQAVFFETFAARMFANLGFAIEVRQEVGVKGQDFDFVAAKQDAVVNCEVTALTAKTYSTKTVANALEQKRKQLPKDKPAVIFVVVPEEWFVNNNDDVVRSLREDALAAFKKTHRINAIVFLNEHHNDFGLPDRGNLEFQFDPLINSEARHFVDDLIALTDGTLHLPSKVRDAYQLSVLEDVHQETQFFSWATEFWVQAE